MGKYSVSSITLIVKTQFPYQLDHQFTTLAFGRLLFVRRYCFQGWEVTTEEILQVVKVHPFQNSVFSSPHNASHCRVPCLAPKIRLIIGDLANLNAVLTLFITPHCNLFFRVCRCSEYHVHPSIVYTEVSEPYSIALG